MKPNIFQHTGKLALMAVLMAGWTAMTAVTPSTQNKPPIQDKWIKLGDRTLTYTPDHSQIILEGIEESLTALRVKVKKGALNLHRCAIFYKNGQTQDIDILNSIPEGGQSKVIELPPNNDQLITKIVFTYDTKNRAVQKADVELWGRQN